MVKGICGIKFKMYPIFVLTVALASGIWWQSQSTGIFLTLLIGISALAVLAGTYLAKNRLQNQYGAIKQTMVYTSLALSFFCLGLYLYDHAVVLQQELYEFTGNHPCNILGTITEMQKTNNKYLRYALTLSVTSLCQSHDPDKKFTHTFLLRVYTCFGKNLCVSDQIFVDRIYCTYPKNKEFITHLLKNGVLASVAITNRPIQIVTRPAWSGLRAIDQYRSYLLGKFNTAMDEQTYKAFASIFLGNQQAKRESTNVKNALRTWGLFHYIARAGLHLVIFISIWVFILGLLPIPFVLRQIILIAFCCLYFLLTWSSIPFNRAFFSFTIMRVCTLLRIRTYSLSILSLIAFITLIMYPLQLFSLDFQLSFGITFALAWFNETRTIRP